MRWVFIILGSVVVAAGIAFVLSGRPEPRWSGYAADPEKDFKDQVQANASPTTDLLDLEFTDAEGKPVSLKDYQGKQNVVLVFTRGFSGYVCPHCSAQTSRLITQQDEFVNRNAAVLVVFPGPKEHL